MTQRGMRASVAGWCGRRMVRRDFALPPLLTRVYPSPGCHASGANVMVGLSCADVVALRHTFRIVGTMIGGMSGAPPRYTEASTPLVLVTLDGALRDG